jgi:hypothetical protein
MHTFGYAFMVFGAVLAFTGIALFMRMGTQGTSSLKMFGFEFQLGGSALVIFVVGAVLFAVPVIYGDRLLIWDRPVTPKGNESAPKEPSSGIDKATAAAFVIVDERDGRLHVDYGLFSTLDQCNARIKALANTAPKWAPFIRCETPPSDAFCSSYHDDDERREIWKCHLDLDHCKEDLRASEVLHGDRLMQCGRMAFAQILPKLR